MFPQIPGTQLSCYLGAAPWDSLQRLGEQLLGPDLTWTQAADPTLDLRSAKGHFRVERYALQPERYPWTYLAHITLNRDPSPLDGWQQVQFARQAALATQATAYCDIPPDVAMSDPADYWQLQLKPEAGHIEAAMAQFEELDEDLFSLRSVEPIDLRNFEWYQLSLQIA
jgi:hypothetical protein